MTNSEQSKQTRAALTLAALGVVYGDIGTSPLYTAKEVFSPRHGIPFSVDNVLGGVSAIFWSLVIVVSLKYVILVMRADNKGEGGIMALLALALASVRENRRLSAALLAIGVFGAALFFGEGVITPAISVLSAVEGLEIAAPPLEPYVVPLTVAVIVALFAFQRHGSSAVGALFGPVMLLWFATLALIGVTNVLRTPEILWALDPLHALRFLSAHGIGSFLVLGAVVLAVTGVEALYADMGHFGKNAIRQAWFWCVFPALVLNYFGQGAQLIANPTSLSNPFYLLFPEWALYPMVALATAATVIASQAVITGTYSMTKQAIQLGFLPRAEIIHTSAKEAGQIYIASINWTLFIAIVAAVVGFGSSSRLAHAYGLAVTGTMLMTTLLTFFVARGVWRYNLLLCILTTGFFLVFDTAFFTASLVKLLEGGWFPLGMGIVIFTLMVTWRRGRELVFERLRSTAIPLDQFLRTLFKDPPHRVPGTAVFLIGDPHAAPRSMLHNLAHNKVIHERIVFLNVAIEEIPWVPFSERVSVDSLGHDCHRVRLRFGFKNRIDVPQALELCREHGLEFNMLETSFFVSRATPIPVPGTGMAMWRERLFAAMARNAGSIVDYFNIPTNRVIELGTQVEI